VIFVSEPEADLVSAALSDKIVFFFVGFIVALVMVVLALLCKQTTSTKKENSYSPSQVTLKNIKSSNEGKDDTVTMSSKELEDGKISNQQLTTEFSEDENLKQNSIGYQRLKQTDNKSKDPGSSVDKSKLTNINKEHQHVIEENQPTIYSQERNSLQNTTMEKKTSETFVPQLPPKITQLHQKNINSNNSNNSVHSPTDSTFLLSRQLHRPPPIQPKMGIHRFNSFRSDGHNVKTKPKLPPKPLFKSKSFQNPKVLPISLTHIRKESNSLTDSEQKIALIG